MAAPETSASADTHDLVVGVDLGGTKTAACAVDADGRVHGSASAPTPAQEGADAVIANVAALVAILVDELPGRIRAIGIGSAGIVDPQTGRILGATDAIRGWAGTPLAESVTRLTGLATRAINDVHAHAIGEHRLGGLADDADVLLVAIGTGIGGSILIDGRPLTGAHAVGGHVGHVPSPHAIGIPCSCGGDGHAEAAGSGPAILEAYRRSGLDAPDTRAVAVRAADGDTRAQAAIELSARTVGALVGGLANTIDPDVVIVSGGVPDIGDTWWAPFLSSARRELLPVLREVPIRAGVGGDAACVGASRLWFDERQD